MYVIFPADEVVYLSYGRLIYVPLSPPENRIHIPIRTSLSSISHTSNPSVPSTSTGSTKSRKSTASAPVFSTSNSNELKSSSLISLHQPSTSRTQVTESEQSPPIRPERKKKTLKFPNLSIKSKSPETRQRKLSYSDFLAISREKSPKQSTQNSDSLARREKLASNPEKSAPNKSEKSPTIRIFREKSCPRNLGRDRTPFDFDTLFKREASPGKLSVRSLQIPNANSIVDENSKLGTRRLSSEKSSSPTKKKTFFSSVRLKKASDPEEHLKMASHESALRELVHPGYNEQLKSHNAVSFKLVRTVSDFTQQLGQMYEQHAEELQLLVANFRKRNGELRKERPACPSSLFHTWETLLQEVEIDSQVLGDIATILGRQVSRALLERSFHRKIQARKVFTHRESYETIIAKTEEKLAKCRQEYKNAYLSYLANPSTESLSAYFNTHNAYVQQLHATNGMMEEFGKETLPSLLQEIEEIYSDLCSTITDSVLQGAEVVSARAMEQCKRYDGLASQCKAVSGSADLTHLARSLPTPPGRGPVTRRIFVPPQPPPPPDSVNGEPPELINQDNIPPPLKDELVIDRLSAVQVKPSHDALRKESVDLEAQIRQIQDALDTLLRIQQRSVEASLYNKANELQEDISMKRFDLRVAQIHLSAINAQKELFTSKLEGDTGRERKLSSASTGSMKNKWLKAFKSLKTPPPETEKKNGSAATRELLKGDPDAHNFQENTYKKITPCDVCSQVLRGHTKQGLKCRICKMNIHLDCQDKASKCQTKAKLLRRQKSTSEIDTRLPEATAEEERIAEVYSMPTINRRLSIRDNNRLYLPPNTITGESPEVDQIYQVLKQATEISNSKPRVNVDPAPPGITVDRSTAGSNAGSSGSSGQSLNRRGPPPQPSRAAGSTLAVINPAPCSTSSDRRNVQGPSGIETSSMRRRLFAGMKSLTGFGSRSRHGSPGHRSISLPERASMKPSASAVTLCPFFGTTNVAPHSPRRQKLNLRMKSLSLDSPESTEHVQRRRHHGANTTSDPHSNQSSSSRIQSSSIPARNVANHVTRGDLKAKSTPSSPVHNRRLLSAKNIRMSSVELPDDNDKSPSSASTSPCPSPVGGKKSHRLLPTNLYVVLYNFKSRHQDELDLKAGYKVTVIDTSDTDWWKGKCLGRVGFFPSKYVSKLSPGEKPLQVTHNLQVSDGDNGLMLLRDQIVIQIGEELDGMVMIRSGENRQGVCPVKFLQEV